MSRMRSILVVVVATAAAAAITGTATAASSARAAIGPPPLLASPPVIVPDPGVTITTDRSKAAGTAGLAPSPGSTCASCGGGGGGPVQGCAVASTGSGDGFGNSVHVYYHWCWLNGSISNSYGWADEAACFAVCNFENWNYNFDYAYGHRAKATFRDVEAPLGIPLHYDSTAAACLGVDGWGNAWAC